MSERRGSVCEVTSPEGHTTLIDEGEPVQPVRRRPRDLTHLAHSKPGASPTDIGAPPASPVFKFPPLCRRSTSDLTTASGLTEETLLSRRPSSPRGLGYLASRRASRESVIAPLRSNYLQPPVADHQRPRVCSLPEKGYNPRYSDDLYRLRNFSITAKGVVNYGDSIIDRRSRSNTSINSTASSSSRDFKALFNRLNDGGCYVHKLNYIQIGRPYIIGELEHVETKMGLALVATVKGHDNSIRVYLPKRFKMSVEDIEACSNCGEIIFLVYNGRIGYKDDVSFI